MPNNTKTILRELNAAADHLSSLPIADLKPRDLTGVYETVGSAVWLIEKCEHIAYTLTTRGDGLQERIWEVYEIFNKTVDALAATVLKPGFVAELSSFLRTMTDPPVPGDDEVVVWLLQGNYPPLRSARALAIYLNASRLPTGRGNQQLVANSMVRSTVAPPALPADFVVRTPRWVPRLIALSGCQESVYGVYEASAEEVDYLSGLLPSRVDKEDYDSIRRAALLLARNEHKNTDRLPGWV